ncbi:MAG TPA: PIN domain-containing protein [Candidatus Sulfotelmatobacter sp.]|nr:PIN domain-containing protein [Candidatus Sulfotelmatobacter sp.]
MILTPDNEYTVLLDACVLVPMPLCETLLRLAEEPALYRPLWSDPILQEVGFALVEMKYTGAQVSRRLDAMRGTFPEAMVAIPDHLVEGLLCIPDPNDRHVLAAAIAGRANAILTLNHRHFPPECLAQYDIERMSPDHFLIHQYHLNAGALLDKIDAQASAIRETRQTVVTRFRDRLQAPTFASIVEGNQV